jgi:hypothetical protein
MLEQSMRLRADELDFVGLAMQQEEKKVSGLCDRALALVFSCHFRSLGSWLRLSRGRKQNSRCRM